MDAASQDPSVGERDDPLDRLPLACLIGPTGVGKTALALELSEQTGCELISLDSMQVYRGMDVGTAKATAEERGRAAHHMLDLVEPSERYDVARYLEDVRGVLRGLEERGQPFLFVGGTAFWLRALVQGLFDGPARDPEVRARLEEVLAVEGTEALFARLERVDPKTAARLHPNDTRRVVRALEVEERSGRPLSEQQREWGWHGSDGGLRRDARIVGIASDGERYEARLRLRVEAMMDSGWKEEALAIRGACGFGETAGKALGYAEMLLWADGELEREACVDEVTLRTRQFARKQRTSYRKLDTAQWIEPPGADELPEVAREVAEQLGLG